ncbi:hypothetical protein LJC04_05450 [Ruminococcaceae bacterium OttesenSCG-928-O06]|nr:hypothetical protein [Ruminococcaceae bacterium OttesenSCG-928-O06]
MKKVPVKAINDLLKNGAKIENTVVPYHYTREGEECYTGPTDGLKPDFEIEIRHRLDFKEVAAFVADVVDNVVDPDSSGLYHPEFVDFMIRVNVLERYCNITIPDEFSKLYALVMDTDIYEIIVANICKVQFDTIKSAINKKIDYCIAHSTKTSIDKFIETMTNLDMSGLYNNIEKLAVASTTITEKGTGVEAAKAMIQAMNNTAGGEVQ